MKSLLAGIGLHHKLEVLSLFVIYELIPRKILWTSDHLGTWEVFFRAQLCLRFPQNSEDIWRITPAGK